jgi:HK97 family phage major capsid protein
MKQYLQGSSGVRVLGALVIMLAFAAGFLDPASAAMGSAGVFMVGDTSVDDLKTLLEKQGHAWEEFKKANDARLAAFESKGFAPADLVGKVDIINADLNKLSKSIADAMLAMQRPSGQDKGLTADEVEHRNALNAYLRKGDAGALAEIQKKAMNSTSDPDGGYLVNKQMDAEIDRVVGTMSALARLARTITIGTRSYTRRVKTAGMSMRRVAEGGTGGETTEPTYARLEFVAHPAEVEPWVYNETLEDADIDLASDLAMEAGISFAEGAAAEYITGNGVGKAQGITAYTNVANASYAWGKLGYIASGKSAAFASVAPADALVNLQHALKAQYRQGAHWLMSDTVLGTVRQFKDSSGAYYMWQPDTTAGFGGRLLGSPVEIDDNMPAVAANSYSLAFGNFQRGYLIVNRTGTTLIRDNITAKGTTKFNFRRRFGGGVYNFEAIKLMKFATS